MYFVVIQSHTTPQYNQSGDNFRIIRSHRQELSFQERTIKSNTDERTRCNNDLLIYKISSICFGQYFAHHQERETEIFFTAYGILLLWWAGSR